MYPAIFIFLILFVLYKIYKTFIEPRNKLNYYECKFIKKGYRVLKLPINPLFSSFIAQLKKDEKKGDAFATVKNQYSEYDVVLTNIRNNPRIILVNPTLIKEYYMMEKDFIITKT